MRVVLVVMGVTLMIGEAIAYAAVRDVTVTDVTANPPKTATTTYGFDSMSRRTSMNDPDSGLWNYQYDLVGNLLFENDPKTTQATPAKNLALAKARLKEVLS